jgi:hypothetical protein
MVKLIIQGKKKKNKKPQVQEQQQKVQSAWQKFWTYSFGVQSWYWCLVFWALWQRILTLCWTAWGRGGDGFPWSYWPSITSGSSNVVPPDDWLARSIYFLLSTGEVAIGT